MGGGNVDTHDARKRMISHGQPSRSGTWGRELHIARWGRAISPHPFSLSSSLFGHCCSSCCDAAASSPGYFPGVSGLEGELWFLFLAMGLVQGERLAGGGGRSRVLLPRPRCQCHGTQKSLPDPACAGCPESSWTGAHVEEGRGMGLACYCDVWGNPERWGRWG